LRDRVRGGADLRAPRLQGARAVSGAAGRWIARHWPALFAWAGVALYLFPIYWMMVSGFKTQAEIFANPPTLIPRAPTLEAFEYVVVKENILRYLRNSVMIAVPVTVVTVVLSAMGAYAMSRLRMRLVDAALIAVLLLQVFPEA